jgi:cation transport regulator ChaB
MRYHSIRDLPFVCQYNLPEAALHVYRDAYNAAWDAAAAGAADRDVAARRSAWIAVRRTFEKDPRTDRWNAREIQTAATHATGKRAQR